MIRKREALILGSVLLLFLISFSCVSAATNTTNTTTPSTSRDFEKSYNCLKSQVNSKLSAGLTIEELAFSMLALAYDSDMQSKLKAKIEEQGLNGECWPKPTCNLKDTSLVLLAYNHIGANTQKIESWLLNQTTAPSDLVWYLQIDSDASERADCTIVYDGSERAISLNPDKTITGALGSCLTSAVGGIWLEVSTACYGKEFQISCNKDFLTNLIYKKRSSSTYYVSAATNTGAPGGKTTEKVESACFKQGSCNYEGSLWASLALQKTGNDIKKFLPYLLTFSSDNTRYMPSAFLYVLTVGFNEYFSDLISTQNILGYWQLSDTSRRYYDTALAIFSLGSSIEASQKAKDYLLEPNVQGEGCYNNNIRDTAFVVYAAAPKAASSGGTSKPSCTTSGLYCITDAQCSEVNGTKYTNYSCLGAPICCSKPFVEKSCSERGGISCIASSNDCTGDWASGINNCCLNGECQEKGPDLGDQCDAQGYICKVSCDPDTEEEEPAYSCPENGFCCKEKDKSGNNYWWLWLLIILVILLVLAIIFRNQLKIWMFKLKSKFSKQPVQQQTRPGFPPQPQQSGMPRRIIPSFNQSRPVQRPFPKDKELDETLKKLKDMGK